MNHLIMKHSYNTDLTFAFYQRGYLKNIDTLIREATIMHEPKPSMTSYVMFILRKCSSECAKSNAVYNLIYSERQKKKTHFTTFTNISFYLFCLLISSISMCCLEITESISIIKRFIKIILAVSSGPFI